MDNFRHAVNATSGLAVEDDSQEFNGDNTSSSGLSGLNCSPKSGSISPFHGKEGQCESSEERGRVGVVEEGEQKFSPEEDRIIIPQLRNAADVSRGRQ